MKKLFSAALAALFALGLAACAAPASQPVSNVKSAAASAASKAGSAASTLSTDSWQRIKDKGEIVVGLDDEFVPMGFKNEKGELVGFDIDMAKEAAGRLGLTVRFQPIDWSLKEVELNTGKIDLIWNGYSITEERKQKVNFTEPYMNGVQVVVTMKKDIAKAADLKGRIVGTQAASTGYDAIVKLGLDKTFKDAKVVQYSSYVEAFLDMEAGRVDALVGDDTMIGYIVAQKKDPAAYNTFDMGAAPDPVGVGVRKADAELLKQLSAVITAMKQDGTAEKISVKWFGKNLVK